jgi:hypothetical protein
MEDETVAKEVARLLGPARLAYFTPVREYPPLGDRKAVALLAADGLMTTVLLSFSGRIAAILGGGLARWDAWAVAAVLAAIVSLTLVGAWHAFAALTMPVPSMPTSLAYFPHIAALSREEYRGLVLGFDHRRAMRDMLNCNYSLAVLSAAKFRRVERSFACVRYTFELWIVLLVLVSTRGS